MSTFPARRLLAALPLFSLPLAGCGAFPADADGTLDRARGATLVVGVSEHPPWAVVDAEAGEVTGSEAELIDGFAAGIDAEIEWHPGPESVLASKIGDGELDVVIGGLTADSPWSNEMALTRPYTSAENADGDTDDMVMGVRMGENELMVALERHLAREHGEIS